MLPRSISSAFYRRQTFRRRTLHSTLQNRSTFPPLTWMRNMSKSFFKFQRTGDVSCELYHQSKVWNKRLLCGKLVAKTDACESSLERSEPSRAHKRSQEVQGRESNCLQNGNIRLKKLRRFLFLKNAALTARIFTIHNYFWSFAQTFDISSLNL